MLWVPQKHTRPVNLYPLFLFFDPEKKNQVQNMGCKKQGAKNRVIIIQKEKKPGCFLSF